MNFHIIALVFISSDFFARAVVVRTNPSEFGKCDFQQQLKTAGAQFTISSPGYASRYARNVSCRWALEAPVGHKLALDCSSVQMPYTPSCQGDRILVSAAGRADLSDAERHCGNGPFKKESLGTKMTVSLKVTPTSGGGKFRCSVRAIKSKCTCGSRNRGKIGGGAAAPNEYPSMAGLVDFVERRIYCGATIISSAYSVTAAHCKLGRAISKLGLIVGEHDTERGSDSNFTLLVRISAFVAHERFNARTNENDIALVRVATPLTFNKGVQPACLPFGFAGASFVSRAVQAVGWGSLEFAGPQPNVLQHVMLKIVAYGNCSSNQLCSFAVDKDTCQSDSGGPLYLFDRSALFLVGIVSYGFQCATREPAVNTKVTAYLNWILENTPSGDYCAL